MRDEIKSEALIKDGVRLTYMPFFIKAASVALKSFPILNSSFIEETESIQYHKNHNISIAMDSPAGNNKIYIR